MKIAPKRATVANLASGLVMVAMTLLSIPVVPLINLPRHIRESRRLGLGQGRVLSRKMTGNGFEPAALKVVCLRSGSWREVLAAVTGQACAAGYAPEKPRDWTRSERNPRYIKRGKMLSILEVSLFLPGETITGSRAVVPEGQTGLRFELRAHK